MLLEVAIAATLAASAPLTSNLSSPQINMAGFINPQITYSQGNHAICVSGTVPVQASTHANARLDIPSNLTTDQATQLILDLNNANSSNYLAATIGDTTTVSGTWNISSRLCFPVNNFTVSTAKPSQVQLLTHGVAFNQAYWDFPISSANASHNSTNGTYSYVDFAAQKGRVTFTYDRLGVGSGSTPDPIQTVQGALEVEILHSLVRMLRGGHLGNISFDTVVGVGHSYGSALTTAVARQYPSDFDAIVLTGFSSNTTGSAQFTSSLNLLRAASVDARFSRLPSGYLVPTTRYGVQYAFFSYPDFEAGILTQAYKTIATTTVGEQVTMGLIGGAATDYSGSVYVLDGQRDLFFCDGDCRSDGQDIPATTVTMLFPVADKRKSDSYILSGSGHGVNLAANADVAFAEIQRWIATL